MCVLLFCMPCSFYWMPKKDDDCIVVEMMMLQMGGQVMGMIMGGPPMMMAEPQVMQIYQPNAMSQFNDSNKKGDSPNNRDFKADYTFDGVNFENIEKIGVFPLIINLKNALQQNN